MCHRGRSSGFQRDQSEAVGFSLLLQLNAEFRILKGDVARGLLQSASTGQHKNNQTNCLL